ncbi:hypothetical protein PLESTM_001123800 [Pleodorina starrii]|nr:hypothetical protein PLESTM_001123800 [Pleodorina starrii]
MELIIAQLVHAANAASRPVASALHVCLCLTYAAHLYRHRHDWASGQKILRSLFFFPLQGGHRHAVFQVFAWGLWTLSAAITLPVYLSILAADSRGSAAAGIRSALLRILGLRKPLIPLTHVDAASGAAAVSGLWGELFMLKALLVFEGGARLSRGAGRRGRQGVNRRDRATTDAETRPQQQQLQLLSSSQQEALPQAAAATEEEEDECQQQQGRTAERSPDELHRTQLLEGPLASLLVCLMGLSLSVTGFVLLLALEHLPDTASGVLYCCLALSCVFIGASSTHGLGGHLRHCAGAASSAGAAVLRGGASAAAAAATAAAGAVQGGGSGGGGAHAGHGAAGAGDAGGAGDVGDGDGEEADVAPTWRFFQPFQGGSVFVATQAIGWTLFSSTVVAVLLLAKELVVGVGYCMRCWALAAGMLMMATQLVLGASILTFQNRRRARKLLQPVLHHPRASLARAAGLAMPVVMMYLPLHVSCSAVAAAFALLPPGRAGAAVAAVLLPYFAITLRGHPAHSGCRRWSWLCRWFSAEVEGSLAWWSGRLEVIRDFPGTAHQAADRIEELERKREREQRRKLERKRGPQQQQQQQQQEGCREAPAAPAPPARRRYVLGFHPHGLYPTGAGFLPLMPSVQSAFPGTTIVTLTASIVHYLPGLRDIAGWAGFRQVTRATFRRALRDTGAVLLCPGGQAELVYADRAIPPRGSVAAAAEASGAAAAAGAAAVKPREVVAAAAECAITATTAPPPPPPEAAAAAAAVERPTGRWPSRPPRSLPAASSRGRHQLVIYAGHQGFVRLALEEGGWLVPVLALGEVLQLRNLISAPEMQRATYKRLGFPVPFILAGRWGLTTLPLRNPLIYVLGAPLAPPAGWEAERSRQLAAAEPPPAAEAAAGAERPRARRRRAAAAAAPPAAAGGTAAGGPRGGGGGGSGGVVVPQEVVDEYHVRFYAALAVLWRRYRHRHPVLAHAELWMEWGKLGPPEDWEERLRRAEAEAEAATVKVAAGEEEGGGGAVEEKGVRVVEAAEGQGLAEALGVVVEASGAEATVAEAEEDSQEEAEAGVARA